jgi:hypothetical protein
LLGVPEELFAFALVVPKFHPITLCACAEAASARAVRRNANRRRRGEGLNDGIIGLRVGMVEAGRI